MIIPIIFVYLAYLVFLVGFFVFSMFGLFHLEEYGYVGDFSRIMIYIYGSTAGAIMLVTFLFLILTFIG